MQGAQLAPATVDFTVSAAHKPKQAEASKFPRLQGTKSHVRSPGPAPGGGFAALAAAAAAATGAKEATGVKAVSSAHDLCC